MPNYGIIEQNLSRTSEELTAQRQGFEAQSRELIEYQMKLEMADTKIASLENALSAAEDKIVALRDDYLFLVQEKANLEGQVKLLQRAPTEHSIPQEGQIQI